MKHEHYIVTGKDVQELNSAISELEAEGYVSVGNHSVVITRTRIRIESKVEINSLDYSQSMIRTIEE